MVKPIVKRTLKIEKESRNVLIIHHDDVQANWEQWYLLSSDRHHDSHACLRDLEIEHLELAKERNAYILDFGDIFDAMQGHYDPRRSYPEMRPEYIQMMEDGRGYLDCIVDDAAKFYGPYADRFLLIARGNHETAIQQHNDTDLINRLVGKLNSEGKTQIQTGEYGGWVRFQFTIGKTQREAINLKYYHGSGGGGPVTKGVIQSNRQAVYLPDAQIVVNGHIHESWVVALKRERLSDKGVISQDLQYHVRTPTYKDDYEDGSNNWHVRRGAPPKPIGATWLRLYHDRKHVRLQFLPDIR